MGHRANFIVIRDGKASAYFDQWAALGSTWAFAGGPNEAALAAEAAEPTTELLDWAFAEAGYLLDFDDRLAIVFGYPESIDPEELKGSDQESEAAEVDAALLRGPLDFLQAIAPRWKQWLLHWDDRGVDAFAAHLGRRGIRSIVTQPPRDTGNPTIVSFQA